VASPRSALRFLGGTKFYSIADLKAEPKKIF
jgi:hypothetical protein